MNRRGTHNMWIQVFAIMFFVLLLVFAIVLLTLDKNRVDSTKEQLPTDLVNQHLEASLIALLRQPMQAEIGGERVTVSLASLISLDQQSSIVGEDLAGPYDRMIAESFDGAFGSWAYSAVIAYPGGDLLSIKNAEIVSGTTQGQIIESFDRVKSDDREAHSITTYLPGAGGNIRITLVTAQGDKGSMELRREGFVVSKELIAEQRGEGADGSVPPSNRGSIQ